MSSTEPRLAAAIIATAGLAGFALGADAHAAQTVAGYCRAHPDEDFPAKAFYGPKFQFGMTPREVARHGANAWRCADGRVWICHIGADGRACNRLNPDPAPAQPVREFCTANPGADFVPMVVVGDSATTWRCRGATPEPLDAERLDKRGFITKAWRPLRP
jgi:hypothetical protein